MMDTAQLLVVLGGSTVLSTIAGAALNGVFGWAKSRGEGRQATGAGVKSEAEGQVALSAEWRAERDNILRQASQAREGAQAAEQKCLEHNRRMRADFEAFADVMEELIPLLPEGESQRKARVALRAARLAI